MSEIQRERFYWFICVIFVVLSPLAIFHSWLCPVPLHYDHTIMGIGLFGAMAGGIFLDGISGLFLGTGVFSRFWITHPTTKQTHVVNGDVQATLFEIDRRLALLGFSSELDHIDRIVLLTISKPIVLRGMGYLDHAFEGSIRIEFHGDAASIEVSLTQKTIVFIETGEREYLRALARYLQLAQPSYAVKTLSPNLDLTTVGAAVTTAAPMLGGDMAIRNGWAFSIGSGAFAMTVIMMIPLLMDRRNLIGTRIGLASLYLTAIPLIPWARQGFPI